MNIKKKERPGLSILLKLDYSNWKKLIKEIKILGQKYEAKSNVNKLNYSINVSCQRHPYMKVKGWCSRVVDKNGRVTEVFFCDYDNILFRVVEDEIRYMMDEYDMPPFYVFTTFEEKDCNGEWYGNYIIVCLKKQTFKKVVDIQKDLHADQSFKQIPLINRFRTWVLRLGNKGTKRPPKFRCIIGDINKEYSQEVSEAHLKAIEGIYPNIPRIKYTNLDGNDLDKLFLTEYITASS